MDRNGKRIKLTKANVDRIPFAPHGEQHVYHDMQMPGFGLRVGTRTKAYFAERNIRGRYTEDGAAVIKRVTVGRHGVVTAEQARDKARQSLAKMADGIDPVAERIEAMRKYEASQIRLQDLWKEFKDDRAHTRKPGTLKGYDRYMQRVFKPWLDRPAEEITRQDAIRLHRRLGEESGNAYANGALRVLSSVMSFGITRERVKENPVDVMRRVWFKVKPRKTYIPDDKLPAWFKAVEALRFDRTNPTARVGGDYLEFVLLTGLRRNEAARLTWDRVDLHKKTVTIVETKNDDPLVLPLSDQLCALLERRWKAVKKSCPWVFPTPGRKGKAYLVEPRNVIELVTSACKVKHTVHDLRRTFISVACRLVPYAVVKTIVNHRASSKGDVTLDYVSLGVEELRPHVQAISDHFGARKAAGQGMRLAKATVAS
jgi:integrase